MKKTLELRFYRRLKEQLDNFNLQKAESLSVEIHEAESNGYKIRKSEDKLWMDLTSKILEALSKK